MRKLYSLYIDYIYQPLIISEPIPPRVDTGIAQVDNGHIKLANNPNCSDLSVLCGGGQTRKILNPPTGLMFPLVS